MLARLLHVTFRGNLDTTAEVPGRAGSRCERALNRFLSRSREKARKRYGECCFRGLTSTHGHHSNFLHPLCVEWLAALRRGAFNRLVGDDTRRKPMHTPQSELFCDMFDAVLHRIKRVMASSGVERCSLYELVWNDEDR